MRRAYAMVLLGWHLLLHVLKKVTFLYDPGGIDAFRHAFDADGLGSLTARESDLLAEWRRCIGCGLCEAATPELHFIPARRRQGPSYLAMSASRDLSELEWARDAADAVEVLDRDSLRDICPVDIDLVELAEFVADRAK
jgi:ferredoxin